MILERRHLNTLMVMQRLGSIAKAAEQLHITQSALSHQIKLLESYYGISLFHRYTKPIRLSVAGLKLVKSAEQILPLFDQAERDLERLIEGHLGRLHISIECHACFEWLLPVINQFKDSWSDVEVDIRQSLTFNSVPALKSGDIDLVITSDPFDTTELVFEPLFDYESLLVLSRTHRLSDKAYVVPRDLRDEMLITYPVERERMDIFKYFLQPGGVEPKDIRQVELTAMILLLIASNQGIAALPDWVMRYSSYSDDLVTKPLGKEGLHRTLFAAFRSSDVELPYLSDFIRICAARI